MNQNQGFRRALLTATAAALCTLSVCGCSAPHALSAEETAKLREEYDYVQANPTFCFAGITEDIRLWKNDDTVALVAVTVTEREGTAADGPFNSSYYPVHVDEVLDRADDLPELGDEVIHFNDEYTLTGYERLVPGNRFLLMLFRPDSFAVDKGFVYYQSSLLFAFQLTEDGVLVSMNDFPGFDQYTGWYLDEFARFW